MDGKKVASTVAGGDGTFVAKLPATPAGINHTIVVADSSGGIKTLQGVAFGDVYSCHGQSHMTFSINQVSCLNLSMPVGMLVCADVC